MTTKNTEHPLEFHFSWYHFIEWMYNLRANYPNKEIYIGDDDVCGAFRQGKWNPQVVKMQCFITFGYIFFATGLTFGGNNCPPNWEIIAVSRRNLARHLWHKADTISRFCQSKLRWQSLPPGPKLLHSPPQKRTPNTQGSSIQMVLTNVRVSTTT